MKRPTYKTLLPTKVAKAVALPKHSLSNKLEKVLKSIDAVHSPKNLKTISVIMDRRILGGLFFAYADYGPYEILLDPNGDHPELSLLHEIGHYLEWQCIPKNQSGLRDFSADTRFNDWLHTVFDSPTIQRLLKVMEQQEGTPAFTEIAYFLRQNELWTRAYSQYIARVAHLPILFQQIASENKRVTGNIRYELYWSWEEFTPIQSTMDAIFTELGWSK